MTVAFLKLANDSRVVEVMWVRAIEKRENEPVTLVED
jgi:hypothetical protein